MTICHTQYLPIYCIKAKHVEFRESLLYGGFSTIPVSSSLLGEVFPNLPNKALISIKMHHPLTGSNHICVTMTWIFQFQQQKITKQFILKSFFSQQVLESLNPYDATRLGDLSSTPRDFEVPNFIKLSIHFTIESMCFFSGNFLEGALESTSYTIDDNYMRWDYIQYMNCAIVQFGTGNLFVSLVCP